MLNAYSLSLFLPGITGLVLCGQALRRRAAPGAAPFALLAAAVAVYSLGYAGELANSALSQVLAWNKLEYLGIAAIPALWVLFCLDYVRGGRGVSPWFVAVLFAVPLATVALVWTMGLGHGLYYQNPRISLAGPFPTLEFERGPAYLAFIAYLNLCLLAGTVLVWRFWRQTNPPYRGQAAAMILATLIPWAAHLAYLARLTPANMDPAPFALAATCLVSAWALFRTRLFDLSPVAHALLLEAMQDGVLVLDSHDRVMEINPAGAQLTGESGRPMGRPARQALERLPGLSERLESLPEGQDEVRVERQEGEMWLDVRVRPLPARSGRLLGRLVVLRDVTQRRLAEERLREMGLRDALTGLHNRGFFTAEMARLARQRTGPVSFLMADLDGLKQVNDESGHAAGDELIRRTARAFAGAFRAGDVAARLGGDEFAALLPGCDEAAAAEALARVERNVRQENTAADPPLSLSLGAATALPGESLDQALEVADQAMYRAKRQRRG